MESKGFCSCLMHGCKLQTASVDLQSITSSVFYAQDKDCNIAQVVEVPRSCITKMENECHDAYMDTFGSCINIGDCKKCVEELDRNLKRGNEEICNCDKFFPGFEYSSCGDEGCCDPWSKSFMPEVCRKEVVWNVYCWDEIKMLLLMSCDENSGKKGFW